MSLARCGILVTNLGTNTLPVKPRSLTESKTDLTTVENANWGENAKYIFDPEIHYINADEPITVQTYGKSIIFDYEAGPENPKEAKKRIKSMLVARDESFLTVVAKKATNYRHYPTAFPSTTTKTNLCSVPLKKRGSWK